VPWNLVTIGGARGEAAPLERAAEAAGLERMSVNPGMVLAPIPEEEKNPVEELSVSIVDTQEELLTYIKVLAEGFETPLDLLAPLNKPESLGDLDVTRYIGRAGGQPVVTGLRTTANRVGVIFNVVTLPAWRRRGFGRAITMRAARDGIAEGCVASFLQSSIIGFSMYLHAGYRHVTDFHVWMLKSPQ
jgi:GNAT superfamily N-acetyltransferase